MRRCVFAGHCVLRFNGSYTQCPWRQIAAATKRRDVCTSGRIFSRIRIAPWRRRRRRYGEGEIAGFLWDYSSCTRCHGRCGYAENGVILQQRRAHSVAAATCRQGRCGYTEYSVLRQQRRVYSVAAATCRQGRCGYTEYSVLRQQRRAHSVAAAFKAAMRRCVFAGHCVLCCDSSYTQCPWRQIAAATKRRDVCT